MNETTTICDLQCVLPETRIDCSTLNVNIIVPFPPNSIDCPRDLPEPGSTCRNDVKEQVVCSYNENCCCDNCVNTEFAFCEDDNWMVKSLSLEPCPISCKKEEIDECSIQLCECERYYDHEYNYTTFPIEYDIYGTYEECQDVCTADAFLCDNGEYVGRNPCHSCKFWDCDIYNNMTAEASCKNMCTEDVFQCKNGTYVERDPCDDCNFLNCDTQVQENNDFNFDYNSSANFMSSSVFNLFCLILCFVRKYM